MDIISSLSSGVTYLLNRFFSEYSLQNWLGNLNDVRQWTEISLDLRLRSSGAIGSTCDVLAQLSVISQLGVYIMGGSCSFCRSVGCVPSGSGYHQLAFCGFCWKVKIWVEGVWVLFVFFVLLVSFHTFWWVTGTSPLVFGSSPFVHQLLYQGDPFVLTLFVICALLC